MRSILGMQHLFRPRDCARPPTAALSVAAAVVLSGCQAHFAEVSETPEVTADVITIDAVTETPPKEKPPELISATAVEVQAKATAKVASAPPVDLLARIRSGLSLPESDDQAVQRELTWYLSHGEHLDRVFNRADRYLYYIIEELDRRGMPADFALLPVVESAYDPFAYSHGRAAGLWQIIPGTATRLGVTQNWWYDGRRDAVDSTRAALDYLEYLHEMFDGDWLLALAGYNAGEGNVTRAIARALSAGEEIDFWHIRPYLPIETRAYVPRLLAIAAVLRDSEAHGIELPTLANAARFESVDTSTQIDMALAAELAGLTTDRLYEFNAGVNRWATDPEGGTASLIDPGRKRGAVQTGAPVSRRTR
ncbi:MAG: transglycosylase SLT domain-containing protein [Candidatus Rariloculaceae bacterium]